MASNHVGVAKRWPERIHRGWLGVSHTQWVVTLAVIAIIALVSLMFKDKT